MDIKDQDSVSQNALVYLRHKYGVLAQKYNLKQQ